MNRTSLRRQDFIADQEEQRRSENATLAIAEAHALAFETAWQAATKARQSRNLGFARAILDRAQHDLDALKACLPDV